MDTQTDVAVEPAAGPASEAVRQAKALREGVRARMIVVEAAVTRPVGNDEPAWWAGVLEALTELRDAFRHHITATEAEGGLHDEIVRYAPRLAHARNRLVRDHVNLAAMLDSLCASSPPPGGATRARDAVVELLGRLSQHRHRGAEFVYDAYTFDIGEGD
ncbi:MAG TPA: hypothetical protein VI854_08735 [Acidimicrobiia bacterium]|nr:hypothetical protein [Acidimicrobiia bacterium]